jgi:hypothetical protein
MTSRRPLAFLTPILCFGLLSASDVSSRPADASTLLFWSDGAAADQVQAWKDRLSLEKDWTLLASGSDDPAVRRAAGAGRLPKSLLQPKDVTDLVLLSKAMGAEWAFLPGSKAMLVSAKTLQAAYLPLGGDAKADGKTLEETAAKMKDGAPSAGQLESLAARWLSYGNPDSALDLLLSAQQVEPDRSATQTLFIDAYRMKADYPEARRFARMALRQYPHDPGLLRAAGELEAADGSPQKALDYYDQAISAGAPSSPLRRLKGDAFLKEGRIRSATGEYRLALDQPGVAAKLARLMAQQGDWNGVASLASRALEENPADWETRLLVARSLSLNGKYAEAARDRAKTLTDAAEADNSSNPLSLARIQSAIRDQLSDTINAVRQFQTTGQDKADLYAALQESVLASDRLRSSLPSRPDWDGEQRSGKRYYLALTLWSQGAYDLMKALEDPKADDLNDSGGLLFDALRQLDEARRTETQARASVKSSE